MANESLILVGWACRYETGCGTCVQVVELQRCPQAGERERRRSTMGRLDKKKEEKEGGKRRKLVGTLSSATSARFYT